MQYVYIGVNVYYKFPTNIRGLRNITYKLKCDKLKIVRDFFIRKHGKNEVATLWNLFLITET